MGRVGSLLKDIDQYSTIIQDEVGGAKLVWEVKMAYSFLRYGAKPVDYWRFQFWRKSPSECDKYLTSMKYSKLYKKLRKLTDDKFHSGGKVYEYNLLKDYIKRDWMVVDKDTSVESITEFLNKHHTTIAKPNKGEQGHGIFKVSDSDKESIAKLESERNRETYILEECLQNADGISEFNKTSLNTLRCYTFIDKKGGAHLLELMLRIGALNANVDNWGAGGVGYVFDIETGICMGPGIDKQNKKHILHPGSNQQVIGYQLPNFDGFKKYVFNLMNVDRNARFVGWDIALTPNGYDIIEMNCPGGHDFLQVFGTPWGEYIKENW